MINDCGARLESMDLKIFRETRFVCAPKWHAISNNIPQMSKKTQHQKTKIKIKKLERRKYSDNTSKMATENYERSQR